MLLRTTEIVPKQMAGDFCRWKASSLSHRSITEHYLIVQLREMTNATASGSGPASDPTLSSQGSAMTSGFIQLMACLACARPPRQPPLSRPTRLARVACGVVLIWQLRKKDVADSRRDADCGGNQESSTLYMQRIRRYVVKTVRGGELSPGNEFCQALEAWADPVGPGSQMSAISR